MISVLRVLTGVSALSRTIVPAGEPAFRDPSLPVEDRVGDVVSRMTPGEKVSQMMITSPAIPRPGIFAYDWWSEGLHGIARARRCADSPPP